MKNLETERDMLTQLYSKNSFYSETDKLLAGGVYPVTVVVCNANGIGIVNDVYGWRKGNELLRQAAGLLRENLPAGAVLARLADGDMAAALTEVEQEYAVRLFEHIKEQYRQGNDTGINTDIEYGIAVIRDQTKSVEEAVREASESMRTKKLMNQSSKKSSLLDSLAQTLTEVIMRRRSMWSAPGRWRSASGRRFPYRTGIWVNWRFWRCFTTSGRLPFPMPS